MKTHSGRLKMLMPAELLSNCINPLLTLALLVAIILRRSDRPGSFIMVSIASIAIAVFIAEHGKQYGVLPGDHRFPSGHQTYAVSTATCTIFRDRRFALFIVPICIIMGFSLVAAHWHKPIDVLGGTVLGMIVPLPLLSLWHRAGRSTNSHN